MKKVLLVSNKVFHYRVANYNYFSSQFEKHGYRFLVRASELESQNPYAIEFDFAVIPFGFNVYRAEIERLEPSVVIMFMHLKEPLFWPLLHWLKWKGIPVVYWNKGINLEVRNPRLRNLPFYYVHALSDAILLYSNEERKFIWGANKGKVFVAENTINFNVFPRDLPSKEEIKRELGIPFRKVVLFVGRMRPVKKVEHLIEAFNGIEDENVGCVIVGDRMGKHLESMFMNPNIRYLGEVHDQTNVLISKIFKMADVFCIPGDVGLGLNQAFFWGLPVVTERGLQPPEIHHLTEGKTGFIVPENDVAELRRKLLLLLHADDLRDRMGQDARNHILERASPEAMFNGFLACVEAVMSR